MPGELTILDGGMGKLLERSGAPFRQPEWSALALIEDPDSVRRAHMEYVESGADVITVNAYAVVPFHIGEDRFHRNGAELIELAARLAREAADSVDRQVRVAASVPPLFGSYEPDQFDAVAAPALYDVMVEAQRPFVDLWIGETMSCISEALSVIEAVQRGGGDEPEIWMSFTVPDESSVGSVALRSGETIANAVDAVASSVSAILFNCSPPEAISAALTELAAVVETRSEQGKAASFEIGAFANAFEPKLGGYAANEVLLDRREELTPGKYREIGEAWLDLGATILGGCCQMFPEHISELVTLNDV